MLSSTATQQPTMAVLGARHSTATAPRGVGALVARPVRMLQQQRQQRPHLGRRQSVKVMAGASLASAAASGSELVTDGDAVLQATSTTPVLLVDWMATWCRKCLYLKPKLQRLLDEEFADVPLMYVDVNAVPGDVVRGAGVKSMPTLQLYKGGKMVKEIVAGGAPSDVVEEVRQVLRQYVTNSKE